MLMSAVYSWVELEIPPTPNSSMSPPPDSAAQQIGAAAIWRRAIRYCRPPPLFLFLHLTLFYRSLLRQYYKAKQQNPVQVQLSRPQYNLYMSQSKTKKKKGEKPSNCQSMPGHNSHVGSETSGILDSLAG